MALIDSFAVLGCGSPCTGEFGRDQLLARMDQLGITHAIVASSLSISSDFVAGNEWLAEQIAGQKRLLGYAVVNVNHPEESIECMRKYMAKHQFVGLMVIQGDGKTPVSLHDADEVINAYRRFGKPMLLSAPNRHCVYSALTIAERFENIKVILMGMGGKDWRSAVTAAAARLNVYLSTTGEVSPDRISEGWKVVNGHRMVFGSGAPLVDPAVALGMVEEAGIKDRDLQALLSGNAERIFAG